ncbi:hypothetical protein ANCCAN_12929, partial [Ancylostoma caninum]
MKHLQSSTRSCAHVPTHHERISVKVEDTNSEVNLPPMTSTSRTPYRNTNRSSIMRRLQVHYSG